jgi:hypothetical protein
MNDHELDLLITSAAPVSDADIAELARSAPVAGLCDAIVTAPASVTALDLPIAAMGTADADGDEASEAPAPPRRRRRGQRAVRVAVAAVAAALVAGVLLRPQPDEVTVKDWSPSAVQVAHDAPRLLIGEPGWEVSEVVDFEVDDGQLRFRGPAGALDLHWRPGDAHQGYVDDRAASSSGPPTTIIITDLPAVLFQYRDSGRLTALWVDGPHALELSADDIDPDEFRHLAESLERVDVDTWLSALPPSVVRAENRAASVAQILSDIPLPDGFDVSALESGGDAADRYTLGVETIGPVACAWIEQWEDATAGGDTAAAQRAVDAMGTIHDWAILQEMDIEGDWPNVLWHYTDALAAGHGELPNGKPVHTFCTNR